MKIENLKINSFGKLKDKEINLSDGINLIYGNNEAGKSTMLKFIENTFYGTSKNKKGKSFSDYDLYKPWNSEEFSGKIAYKLDNGEKFEVYREFGKKSPKVYNEKLEDVTKEYSINKNTGSDFFFEQTKVDEFMFLSSIVSMQKEVKLNTQDQNVYIQKLANLASTGDDSVSFKKAMDKLNKKQVDEIGTDRTLGKPINVAKNNIEKYEKKIEELSRFKQNKVEIDEKEKKLQQEIKNNKYKSNFIKELQEIEQIERIEKEKIKLNESIIEKNNEQINVLEKEIKEVLGEKEILSEKNISKEKGSNVKKINSTLYIALTLAFFIIGIICFVLTKNVILTGLFVIPIVLTIILYFVKKNKINNQISIEVSKQSNLNSKLNEKASSLKNQIDLINKNNEDMDKQIETIKETILNDITVKKDKLKSKYLYQIDLREISNLLASQELSKDLNRIEERIHTDELKLNMITLEKKNVTNNLEDLVSIEEKLEISKQEYNELMEKNYKINKARELLQKAYENMKNSVTPKFTANLSSNIDKISNGKYKTVWVNDEEGMIVGLPNGEYVSAEKLSTGTIEQLYLSLRLSMAKEISTETMPIILDEAFAYYDDERLENVLEFLTENFKENQIILLTCTHREENMLKTLGKTYELINLNY